MDVTDSTVVDSSEHDWATAGVDDFLSFCDDVSKREALFGDNKGPVGDGHTCETSHSTADAELDRESMVSPTTVASVEQMAHGNEVRTPGQTLDRLISRIETEKEPLILRLSTSSLPAYLLSASTVHSALRLRH